MKTCEHGKSRTERCTLCELEVDVQGSVADLDLLVGRLIRELRQSIRAHAETTQKLGKALRRLQDLEGD